MNYNSFDLEKYVPLIFLFVLMSVAFFITFYILRAAELVRTARIVEVSATSVVLVKQPSIIFNVSVFTLQTGANPGQTVSANITVTNDGGYEGDVRIEWWAEDSLGNTIASDDTSIFMNISYTWTSVKDLLMPSNATAGVYYFKVIAIAPGYIGEGFDTFDISLPESAAPTVPTPSPGFSEHYATQKKEIEVYFPSKVLALLNHTKEFQLVIKNTGNVEIRDLSLVLQGLELGWFQVFPSNISVKPNETKTFTVKLAIPAEALVKDYDILASLRNEITKFVQLTLSVRRAFDYEELIERIRALKSEMEILKNETEALDEKNIDVAEIEKVLSLVEQKLNSTGLEVLKGNLETASEQIYEIESLIHVLESAIREKEPVEIRFWSFFSIYALLAVIAIAIGIWFTFRHRTLIPTFIISEIFRNVDPGKNIQVYAELTPLIYAVPIMYSLSDDSGSISAMSSARIKKGYYGIEAIVREVNGKKYLEIRKIIAKIKSN